MYGIIKGKPYLISWGMAYPIKIVDGVCVETLEKGTRTDEVGSMFLFEIIAKCGANCSSIPVKKGTKKV